MISPEEQNRIERMTRSLYSRKSPAEPKDTRAEISREQYIAKEEWDHPEPSLDPAPAVPKRTLFRKILIGSIIFFLACAGIAAAMFFGGFNIISSQNVDITVVGPVSVGGGEPLPLQIAIENKNNTDLESATLTVEYPVGTKSATDIMTDYPRYTESIGTIPSGQIVSRSVSALLFGGESTAQDIQISVQYKVKGSNAFFTKQKTYEVTLGASPVAIKVDGLQEINANQDAEFKITLTSNSNTTLQNVLLTAEYPFGFGFESASSSPSYGTTGWNIGSMAPGEQKIITVKGKIQGEDGEVRVFHWNVGLASPDNPKLLQTTFASILNSVNIKKPFLSVGLSLDGDSNDGHVAARGRTIQGTITWINNLPTKISNAEIDLSLNGTILNRQSINAEQGFFRSLDNTIVWNSDNTPALGEINPGANNSVGFSFGSFDLSQPQYAALTDPQMKLSVSVKGNRIGDNNVPETITSTVTRNVKVSSTIAITPSVAYSTGPFHNSGPLPPKVEQATTYTVTWTATNASSNVSDARASAVLPPYVSWVGATTPAGERLTYNPDSNTILWQIGPMTAGTGYGSPARQVSFQIQFVPGLGQSGQTPELVHAVDLTADDDFTGASLDVAGPAVTTNISGDPVYVRGKETVSN